MSKSCRRETVVATPTGPVLSSRTVEQRPGYIESERRAGGDGLGIPGPWDVASPFSNALWGR